MKVAMWGVGLLVIGLFGLVLVNLFGNITVTNQFDYTTMKNAVQAAVYDSLDIAHYRVGFCLCTSDGSPINSSDVTTFRDKSQYVFRDIVDDSCGEEKAGSCVKLYGQYRLDPEKFPVIFENRFNAVKMNNKDWGYEIREVIEYPPKVSIRIMTTNEEYSPTDKASGTYNITNQIDAIIETDGDLIYVSE